MKAMIVVASTRRTKYPQDTKNNVPKEHIYPLQGSGLGGFEANHAIIIASITTIAAKM
jgi:hypothetical protein